MRIALGVIALSFSAASFDAAKAAPPCSVGQLPASRQGGDLIVTSPPLPAKKPGGTRLRSHVDGPLGAPPAGKQHPSYKGRRWAGPEVPTYVPLTSGTRELFLLDHDDEAGRYMALYRDPYGESSCNLGDDKNCSFEVRVFDCGGSTVATLPLDGYFSKPEGLELQDVRLAGDTLYFNEACQSYSKEQKGKCSALVAVDIKSKKLVWRTKNLVSNGVFLVTPKYLITGYGFTSEPSSLFLVKRKDGAVAVKQPMKDVVFPGGNHDSLTLFPGDLLRVGIYEHPDDALVQIEGLAGDHPKFHAVKDPKDLRTTP